MGHTFFSLPAPRCRSLARKILLPLYLTLPARGCAHVAHTATLSWWLPRRCCGCTTPCRTSTVRGSSSGLAPTAHAGLPTVSHRTVSQAAATPRRTRQCGRGARTWRLWISSAVSAVLASVPPAIRNTGAPRRPPALAARKAGACGGGGRARLAAGKTGRRPTERCSAVAARSAPLPPATRRGARPWQRGGAGAPARQAQTRRPAQRPAALRRRTRAGPLVASEPSAAPSS